MEIVFLQVFLGLRKDLQPHTGGGHYFVISLSFFCHWSLKFLVVWDFGLSFCWSCFLIILVFKDFCVLLLVKV